MADTKTDVNVLFNASAVKAAQHQKILQSWLSGATDQYPGQARNETEIEQEEKGIFTLESEIAGLGVPPQSLADDGFSGIDPFARAEDSSTAFLRQQLIGNKAKGRKVLPPTRSAINLPGVEPGFQPSKLKATATVLSSAAQNDQRLSNVGNPDLDLDDEDDIGRTGLGKRKRGLKGKIAGSPTPAPTRPADGAAKGQEPMTDSPPSSTRNENDEEDSQSHAPGTEDIVAKAPITKKSKSSTKPKARSYLDEILAAKEAKRQRKKNKGGGG